MWWGDALPRAEGSSLRGHSCTLGRLRRSTHPPACRTRGGRSLDLTSTSIRTDSDPASLALPFTPPIRPFIVPLDLAGGFIFLFLRFFLLTARIAPGYHRCAKLYQLILNSTLSFLYRREPGWHGSKRLDKKLIECENLYLLEYRANFSLFSFLSFLRFSIISSPFALRDLRIVSLRNCSFENRLWFCKIRDASSLDARTRGAV